MKYTPFELIGSNKPNNIICICDHASNVVPNFWSKKGLGINRSEMERHIAYDLGAKNLTKALSKLLNGPAILSNFSRLVIDPNRGKNDPTLIMKLYDGTIIPENREISEIEKLRRVNEYYDPYHNAVQTVIDSRKHPIIISIHSFT
ncbi:MAG: N-formylglutamate amidohydrolase, partial [Rhodobacteraceae bacterium]|nr:N-formylglutamate amidohydrolase [Paracoccaceae bacterium]